MNGSTHVRIALACGLYGALLLESDPVPMMSIVAGAFVAARLPDLDIKLPVRHRSVTHSILITALLYFGVFYALPRPLALGFMVGYISHIAADMFTVNGVELLWPIPKRIKVPFFSVVRTGGLLEALLSIGVLIGIGIMLLQVVNVSVDTKSIGSFFGW